LPLDQARNFSVFERGKITLSIGDWVRFTENVKHRAQKFLNNELRTVVGIDEAKIDVAFPRSPFQAEEQRPLCASHIIIVNAVAFPDLDRQCKR